MNIAKLPGNRYIEFLLFFSFLFRKYAEKPKMGRPAVWFFWIGNGEKYRKAAWLSRTLLRLQLVSYPSWTTDFWTLRAASPFHNAAHFLFFTSLLSLSFPLFFFFLFLSTSLSGFVFFLFNVIHSPSPQPAKQNNKTKRFRQIFFFCVYKFSPSSFRWRSIRLYNEKWINTKFRLQYIKYTAVIYENPPLLLIRNIWIEPR